MANFTPAGKVGSKGVNDSNDYVVQFTVAGTQITTSDTARCIIPDHLDKDSVPVSAIAYTRAVTGVLTPVLCTITSHQGPADSGQTETLTVGTTVITPAATIAIGGVIMITYAPYKFGLLAETES